MVMNFKLFATIALIHCSAFAVVRWEPGPPADVQYTSEFSMCSHLLSQAYPGISKEFFKHPTVHNLFLLRASELRPLLVITSPHDISMLMNMLILKLKAQHLPYLSITKDAVDYPSLSLDTNVPGVYAVLARHNVGENVLKIFVDSQIRKEVIEALHPNTLIHFDLPKGVSFTTPAIDIAYEARQKKQTISVLTTDKEEAAWLQQNHTPATFTDRLQIIDLHID